MKAIIIKREKEVGDVEFEYVKEKNNVTLIKFNSTISAIFIDGVINYAEQLSNEINEAVNISLNTSKINIYGREIEGISKMLLITSENFTNNAQTIIINRLQEKTMRNNLIF